MSLARGSSLAEVPTRHLTAPGRRRYERGVRRVARRRSLASASRRSRAHSAAVGDRRSSAQASRWRSMGTWASQQDTEQKTSAVRGRLHVDTLHAQYVLTNGSSFLQVEQRFHDDRSASNPILRPRVHA